MIIIQGHARFAPGTATAHLAAMRTMVEATRAEDGCELYAFAFDATDPDLMHITERWRDQAAVDAHGASAHMATFRGVMGAAAPVEMKIGYFTAERQKK